MGSHPFNLLLRFLLEISALSAVGIWGWKQSDSWLRFVLALVLPLILAIIWGTFAVPEDPSRSGKAPFKVSGLLRILLELGFFSFAVWSLYDMNWRNFGMLMSGFVFFHYLISYDRIIWLLKQ